MGKVFSSIKHPLRNFNVESRAHEVISKDKPIRAPMHEANKLDYERIIREHPEVIEESLKKHTILDKHLRDVYVTSTDPVLSSEQKQGKSLRPLPENRSSPGDFELGYKEPETIPLGKATLKNLMLMISMYRNNPEVNTAAKIASQYSLDTKKVETLIKYVNVFEMYLPQEKPTKAKFAGPVLPRIIIKKPKRPALEGRVLDVENKDADKK